MTDLIIADLIPNLLRRGSPIFDIDVHPPTSGVVVSVGGCNYSERSRISVCVNGEYRDASHPCHYGLDLTDSTGRAHAAYYLAENDIGGLGAFAFSRERSVSLGRLIDVVRGAADNSRMTDEDIKILRDVVLYVAGVADNG